MPDRAGFEAIYAGHLPRVLRACALVMLDRSEAEDVAFLREQSWTLRYILDSIKISRA